MPWTAEWYAFQPWEKQNGQGFYYNAQLRRYGGDLQGIIDKLDYLCHLGVNALYLNPVFESPSYHKYGASMYRHVDNNFGPNPKRDREIWQAEIPDDPDTWQWTSADSLFLTLIREVHARDMKIIIDGVFNHVGIPFWAFQDVKANGKASPYAEWFVIHSFDDPHTAENEFDYQGWSGFRDLPEIKEDKQGPCSAYRKHIQHIVQRWGDPNGDGDPSDGIDGWRLDVAEKVSPNFWREFRQWVKKINPDAYLTGEVWWKNFTDNRMYDCSPWLEGDIFNAVMNYRFGDAMLKAFINREQQVSPSQMDELLKIVRNYPNHSAAVVQNLMGSHDTERFASMVINPDRWIDHACHLRYNPEFKIRKPTSAERKVQRAILAFQFTYLGAPYIFYGDEVGMWGADDPDCRKPMIWEEYDYAVEETHPFGLERPPDSVQVNHSLFKYYQALIKIRRQYKSLTHGSYQTLHIDDQKGLFAFERTHGNEALRMIFNLSRQEQPLDPSLIFDGNLQEWTPIFGDTARQNRLPAQGFCVYLKQNR